MRSLSCAERRLSLQNYHQMGAFTLIVLYKMNINVVQPFPRSPSNWMHLHNFANSVTLGPHFIVNKERAAQSAVTMSGNKRVRDEESPVQKVKPKSTDKKPKSASAAEGGEPKLYDLGISHCLSSSASLSLNHLATRVPY